jgi:replicative DNA helicase
MNTTTHNGFAQNGHFRADASRNPNQRPDSRSAPNLRVIQTSKRDPDSPRPSVDLGAERSFLGGVMVHGDEVWGHLCGLDEQVLWSEEHRQVWRLMRQSHEAGQGVEIEALVARARAKEDAGERGWSIKRRGYMASLFVQGMDCLPLEVLALGKRLQDLASRRTAEAALRNQLDALHDPDQNPAELASRISAQLQEATAPASRFAPQSARDGMKDLWRRMEDAMEGKAAPSISTGLGSLDQMLGGGLHPGEVSMILGRTGGGKSSLSRQLALQAAKAGHETLFFSTEMDSWKAWAAFVSAESGVSARHVINPNTISDDERGEQIWDKVLHAARGIAAVPLFVDDTQTMTCDAVLANIQRFDAHVRAQQRERGEAEKGLGLLVVDYFQIISPDDWEEKNRSTRAQQLQRLMRALQRWARETGACVVVVAQVKGEVAQQRRAPRLGDTAECRSAENWCHVILTVHRPWLDDEDRDRREADIYVVKNRHGETGRIGAMWNGAAARFEERGDWQPARPIQEPRRRR